MEERMYIDTGVIITAGSVLAALTAILALVFKVYRWVLRQDKQDREIQRLKDENTLLCYGVSACLDGLIQLGANHTVPLAKDKLDKYLNQSAHK
ncbi:MAG: branched-chain amino acid ABC transporter permease [Acutalibacteraceae bacterium]